VEDLWNVEVKDDIDPTKRIPWKEYYNDQFIAPTQPKPLEANSNDNYFQVMLESKLVFDKVIELLQSPANKSWGIGSYVFRL